MTSVGGPSENIFVQQAKEQALDTAKELRSEAAEAKSDAAAMMAQDTNKLGDKVKKAQKKEKPKMKDRVQKAGKKAEQTMGARKEGRTKKENYQNWASRNPDLSKELSQKELSLLRDQLKGGDSEEDIMKVISRFTDDAYQIDGILDFLVEDTEGDLLDSVNAARSRHQKAHETEIRAGSNITRVIHEEMGVDKGKSMRDLYVDVTGSITDAHTLYRQLASQYSYRELQKVITFMQKSIGEDLRSGGPSIEPAFLQRLGQESRQLNAINGVYRFHRNRQKLMKKMFQGVKQEMPSSLSFESMSKHFMELVEDRNPYPDKIVNSLGRLGVPNNPHAESIVIEQFRDACDNVAPLIFPAGPQGKLNLKKALIEADTEKFGEIELKELEAESVYEESEEAFLPSPLTSEERAAASKAFMKKITAEGGDTPSPAAPAV